MRGREIHRHAVQQLTAPDGVTRTVRSRPHRTHPPGKVSSVAFSVAGLVVESIAPHS